MKSAPAGQTLVFYDGACAICRDEMMMLKRRDRAGRLLLIDIAAREFNAGRWPVSTTDLNALLHVRTADERWLKGMPAIRHLYRQIGRGWLLTPTGWPLLSHAFDRAYAWFARHRLAVSAAIGAQRCASSVCRRAR